MSRRLCWLALSFAIGCGGWNEVTFTDEGDLCFEQRDASVFAIVTAPDCLQGGCWRALDGECSATVDGTTIELTSEVHWEKKDGPCDSDCGTPSIECDLGALPDGTYSVTHGDEQLTLVVPVEGSCLP